MKQIHEDTFSAITHALTFTLGGYRRATKYLSPSFTVKTTRQHRPRRNERSITVIVTVGAPNYAEREFIKRAKRAGEPFPVKRTLIKEFRQPRRIH